MGEVLLTERCVGALLRETRRMGLGGEKSEVLYVTTGGLFPDSFKQKAIACWMGMAERGKQA